VRKSHLCGLSSQLIHRSLDESEEKRYRCLLCNVYARQCSSEQARNQLGTPVGRRFFWEGTKFFKLCSIILSYVQNIFSKRAKHFVGRASPPWWRTWFRVCKLTLVVDGVLVNLQIRCSNKLMNMRRYQNTISKAMPVITVFQWLFYSVDRVVKIFVDREGGPRFEKRTTCLYICQKTASEQNIMKDNADKSLKQKPTNRKSWEMKRVNLDTMYNISQN